VYNNVLIRSGEARLVMLYSGFNILPRSVFWSTSYIGRSDNLDVIHLKQMTKSDKTARGNASQFFIAGELCRRGHSAVVTLGNCPNTDILCSNKAGTLFVHIQVKTFVPGRTTCTAGKKAEIDYGPTFSGS